MLKTSIQYVLWCAVLLIPIELYFRVSGLGASPRLTVHESGLLTVPQAGSRVVHRREGFGSFEYNQNGLRGPALPLEPAPDEHRVAFIGDSYTEALQVSTDEMFSTIVGSGSDITTLNFGMSGDNLVSELIRYRTVVRPWKPRVVVVASTDGDLLDVMKYSENAAMRWTGDDVEVQTNRLEWNDPATASTYALRQRLRDALESYAVLQRFQALARTARSKLKKAFGGPAAKKAVDAEMREDTTVPPENIARCAEILRTLKREVAADGARLVGIHLPKGYTLRDDITAIRDAYAEAYKQAGVPFVSAYDALNSSYEVGRWTHFNQPEKGGGHLSPRGHAVVREVLHSSGLLQ